MLKAALIASVLIAVATTAPAHAASYPGQRPAGPLVREATAVATKFWQGRGVAVTCGTPIEYVADLPLLGHAEPMQCALWVDDSLIQYAHARNRLARYWGRAQLCRFVVHELGHLGNLEHSPDPDSVMAERPLVDPWDCRAWARQPVPLHTTSRRLLSYYAK